MNILVVRSVNRGISTFIEEQVDSLRKKGLTIDYYDIKGTGMIGYMSNLYPLRKAFDRKNYHLVHAHVGLSGLLANLQRKVPVVTTFHGTDLNRRQNQKYSKTAAWLSRFSILTNTRLNDILKLKQNYAIIPCGIDLENFKPLDRDTCKQRMGLSAQKDYILFSSSYARQEKNAELARQAVQSLKNIELIELKGYSRKEVSLLINASRMLLLTSHYESAPLIVKEALACNRPVVSTDVGDVKKVLEGVQGSYLVDYNPMDVAQKCRLVLAGKELNESRPQMKKYGLTVIAERIMQLYLSIINHK